MAFHHSPKIVTDGLIMYMDAANPKSYSGSGIDWKDLSGNGNNAVMSGVSFSASNKGVMTYAGATKYANISGNIMSSVPTSLTVSAWFKMTASSGWRCALHRGAGASVGASQFWIGITSDTLSINATIGANGSPSHISGSTGTVAVVGTWYNAVATWDGSNVYVYVNGIFSHSYAFTGPLIDPGTATNIGASSTANNYQFYGDIATVSVNHNRYLTANEITQNYDALKGRFGL